MRGDDDQQEGMFSYAPRHPAQWLAKISEVGVLRRAEFYYQQLDALRPLRHPGTARAARRK
jgi:hypothetical protein